METRISEGGRTHTYTAEVKLSKSAKYFPNAILPGAPGPPASGGAGGRCIHRSFGKDEVQAGTH